MSKRIAVVVASIVLAFAGFGIVAAAQDSGVGRLENRSADAQANPPGPIDIIDSLTVEERAAAANAAEDKAAFQAVEDLMAQPRIAVSGPNGPVGYVDRAALNKGDLAEREADLDPVYSESGEVVGYWGTGIGFIERGVVDAAGEVDLAAEMAKKGIVHSGS